MRRAGRLLAAALLVLGCAAPEALPPAGSSAGASVAVAAGSSEYRRKLEAEAGGIASPERLAELAQQVSSSIDAHMNRLADRLPRGGGGDWRPAFTELRSAHPGDVDSLLRLYREELERAVRFVEERDLVGLPPARPKVVVAGNLALRSAFPLALYLDDKLAVTTAATLEEDPGYLANHCRVCVPPLVVHEGYPGHHVAFHHLEQAWRGARRRETSIAAHHSRLFIEGWGLYAEVLMLELGYYADPARELGAWRMLLLRAVRASIDVELHSGELTTGEAVDLYVDQLLMSRDAAETEVRRHLSEPTMKASYFAGLLQLLELRERVRQQEGGLEWRSFHDRLLGQPQRRPIPELARQSFGVELGPLGESEIPWPWEGGG